MSWKNNATKVTQTEGSSWKQGAERVVPEPDLSKFEEQFKSKVTERLSAKAASTSGGEASAEASGQKEEAPGVKEASTFLEAIEAGFDISVTGLALDRPDVVLPENAPMYMRIASQVSTIAGDVPAMVLGGVAGGAAGAAAGTATLPVVGTVGLGAIGAGAGGMAVPEGIRTALMEHYEKGDVQSFSDFWERASAVAINTLKGGVIGGATAGVGGIVGAAVGKAAVPVVAKTTAQVASEIGTMTTIGSALEGEVPEPQDILDAAILVGVLKATGKISTKIREAYAKGGVKPAEIALEAERNPHLKQQLLAENVPLPEGIKTMSSEFGRIETPKPPETFQTTKPLKPANPDLPPDVNTILSKVGEVGDAPKKKLTTGEVYTAFVDKLDPINEATKALTANKEALLADQNPYILARTAVDYKAKAKHFFENGTLNYKDLSARGESLSSILRQVESPETLEAYMISKRVLEKNAQGLQTGFDIAAAEKVVKEQGAKYEAFAKRVTEFSNQTLDYVADSGIISKEQVARMKELNKDYVPFKRIFQPEETISGKGRAGGKAGALKEFKGSEREIQSPILSITENTVELIRMAETNRPKLALLELAEKTPDQQLLKKVKTPVEGITVTKEQVAKELNIPLDQAEAITTFRAMNKQLAPNQFAVMKEGKRQIFETTPELAQAINRIGGDQVSTNLLFKVMNGITTVKKFGITFTPDFIARNLFRDVLTSSTFTKGKGINPLEVLGAMGDLWKKNASYYEWLKSGGANGAFIEMGNNYVKNDILRLQRETNFLNSFRNVVEKPIDAMRIAAELSEQSLRLAEFKKVRQMGGTLTEGGFASREITIDFQRVGAKISALNSITAFMNVSIQGLDRTARAFKENPAGVTTRAVAYLTVPSLLLWWSQKDDPRYQEIPRWQKDLFWIITTDDWQDSTQEEAGGLPEYMVREQNGKIQVNKGVTYRLPKPQELGVLFGSLPERALEAFFGQDEKAFKDFEKTMGELVTPAFVPDAVAPAIEQYFNKSFFTGRDIVPDHLRNVLPEYQFVEYTSETAKTLGKLVATVDKQNAMASPMVLDNYIRSWSGSLGQYAVQLADKALKKAGIAEDIIEPTPTLSDIPFIKAFVVRFPSAQSRSVQDFYDEYNKNQKVFNTIRLLAKQGDMENMEKELTLAQNEGALAKLDGIKEALSSQSNFIKLVNKNPEMTADEKRQMIDGVYLMMIETAKQGNFILNEVKKNVGE